MAEPAAPAIAPWREFAKAPLVPVALAVAVGILVDFYRSPRGEISLGLAAIGLLVWCRGIPFGLTIAFAGLGAAHHHFALHRFTDDDISRLAAANPAIARVRGTLAEEPVKAPSRRTELFGPARRVDRSSAVLDAREISLGDSGWVRVSGRMKITVERVEDFDAPGLLDDLSLCDEIEIVGLFSAPAAPGNPGEVDYRQVLLRKGIGCELRVVKGADNVTRINRGTWSIPQALTALKRHLNDVLKQTLPAEDRPLAQALLLGDTSATERNDWDAFLRTGVLHVLAISGQHLVILAGAIWLVLRLLLVPRRRGAFVVLAIIVLYAALTGGRPSAVRAAVMVGSVCTGIILRRPVHLANSFALSFLIVAAINPIEAISFGSVLSFVSVFVLVWGVARWLSPAPPDAVELLIDESRPLFVRAIRACFKAILAAYALNALLLIANGPMILASQNIISPVSLLIGPPVVLLTTIALLTGVVQLPLGLLSPAIASGFGLLTGTFLGLARTIVSWGDALPGGVIYAPAPPEWWLWLFYLALIGFVLTVHRSFAAALLLILLIAILCFRREPPEDLRITFLSVGHGGCTVIETPDGRVIVYDAGTMAGSDVVRRVIAPYLWHRGIRRIDTLLLSHADLDHYNAVPELLRRFPVGEVLLTPSFASKPAPEVAEVLLVLESHNVPRRIVSQGDRFEAGAVSFAVLHPPRNWPAETENERSLVLEIEYESRIVLLTGDLEKTGTTQLLAQRMRQVDVLMAPHHGSAAAFPKALAAWANPRRTVASRGNRDADLPVPVWDTWTRGAITVRLNRRAVILESFRTGDREVIK